MINLDKIARKIVSCSVQEGSFASDISIIKIHLMNLLHEKYSIDIAYRGFADRIRGPWRDSLVSHWQEHAGEERQMTYDIAMKLVALGCDPCIVNVSLPICNFEAKSLASCLMEMEKKAIDLGRTIISCAGDNTSLRVMMEDHVMKDQQHLDDLRRMFETY